MTLPALLNVMSSIKPFLVPVQPVLMRVPSITISAVITAPMSSVLPANKASAVPMNARTGSRSIILLQARTDVPTQIRLRNVSVPARPILAGKTDTSAAKIVQSPDPAVRAIRDVNK